MPKVIIVQSRLFVVSLSRKSLVVGVALCRRANPCVADGGGDGCLARLAVAKGVALPCPKNSPCCAGDGSWGAQVVSMNGPCRIACVAVHRRGGVGGAVKNGNGGVTQPEGFLGLIGSCVGIGGGNAAVGVFTCGVAVFVISVAGITKAAALPVALS